ncbi:alpha/beta hydrolase [Arthrobacter sp. B2a2-09]|uniref:alpha/beta hydrolase n=1 Tax=Arthrobacter sp. B2a2-09 TaxID=2952822 RepID=UPI0022CD4975|nr:alpha/beta hydrolase [Arthrobacter sp. B2a2-09]MCZ9880618.1 alpha/beta hydrolase [Arthrobacter sp. B2a2-09]
MSMQSPFGGAMPTSTHMAERNIPFPSTISPEAQAALAMHAVLPAQTMLDPSDVEGWAAFKAQRAAADDGTITAIALATSGLVIPERQSELERLEFGTAVAYVATPEGHNADDERIYFNIHGGGMTEGGGVFAETSTRFAAGCYGVRVWGMDYRMLPDHPFPAGLDDCMTVYRELLKIRRPEQIIVGGVSGGANLTAALLLRARDEGLPLPAAAVLYSPAVDFTMSGDTHETERFAMTSDGLGALADFYATNDDVLNPYISPLLGEFTAEFPPTILISGTRDFLLSDTVRLHRKLLKAGVHAELHVFEAAPHGGFGGHAPEDHEQVETVRNFIEAAWVAAAAQTTAPTR